jgi:hypothetical protein
MKRLNPTDLMTLETYARERSVFRERVITHKKRRTVPVGPHLTLLFEDRLTVKYQIQEMLRIERIFEPEGIAAELAAYNPLIPDGSGLVATMLIEYPDPVVRAERLRVLKGLEHRVELCIGDVRIVPLADEDLERENADKTSAVHFLRYPIPAAIRAAFATSAVSIDCKHPVYQHRVDLSLVTRDALARDLQPD